MGRRGYTGRLKSVGEARRHDAYRRRHLNLVCSLLGGLAVRVAQARLVRVYSRHVARAGHSSFGHPSHLGHFARNRARIARHGQLHEQQANQREEHCDQAMAAKGGHAAIVGALPATRHAVAIAAQADAEARQIARSPFHVRSALPRTAEDLCHIPRKNWRNHAPLAAAPA